MWVEVEVVMLFAKRIASVVGWKGLRVFDGLLVYFYWRDDLVYGFSARASGRSTRHLRRNRRRQSSALGLEALELAISAVVVVVEHLLH